MAKNTGRMNKKRYFCTQEQLLTDESLRTLIDNAVHIRGTELREPLRLYARRGEGRYGMDSHKHAPLE